MLPISARDFSITGFNRTEPSSFVSSAANSFFFCVSSLCASVGYKGAQFDQYARSFIDLRRRNVLAITTRETISVLTAPAITIAANWASSSFLRWPRTKCETYHNDSKSYGSEASQETSYCQAKRSARAGRRQEPTTNTHKFLTRCTLKNEA